MSYIDRDLTRWRRRSRRPRLRRLARWLRHAADRIYAEPRSTLEVTKGHETRIFVDCRELSDLANRRARLWP